MARKQFEHEFLKFEELEAESVDGKRYYRLPDGSLVKSVTTIIGEKSDKTALMEWKKRVGEAEAQKISTQAANRGTAMHTICERYLLNEEHYPRSAMPSNIDSFKQLRPFLDRNIEKVYGLEAPLYSYQLKTAGRSDCIASWNGTPTIVDFKTSRKLKKAEWIENYFVQATCYAMMCEERTGLHIPQIVVLIAVDDEQPQLFSYTTDMFVDKVKQIFC